jgi:hypothetical protein
MFYAERSDFDEEGDRYFDFLAHHRWHEPCCSRGNQTLLQKFSGHELITASSELFVEPMRE